MLLAVTAPLLRVPANRKQQIFRRQYARPSFVPENVHADSALAVYVALHYVHSSRLEYSLCVHSGGEGHLRGLHQVAGGKLG